MGRTEIKLCEVMAEKSTGNPGPIAKKLKLFETESGVVSVRLDIHIF